MKGYECRLACDDLAKLREEFWGNILFAYRLITLYRIKRKGSYL